MNHIESYQYYILFPSLLSHCGTGLSSAARSATNAPIQILYTPPNKQAYYQLKIGSGLAVGKNSQAKPRETGERATNQLADASNNKTPGGRVGHEK